MGLFLEPVSKGRKIPIDKAVVFFGRHPDCDVVLTRSRKVSRKHCCIAQVDNRLVIRDLGSMNGIKVNDKKIKKFQDLNLGDILTIGDIEYRLKNNAATSEPVKKSNQSKPSAKAKPSAKSKPSAKRKPSAKPAQRKKKTKEQLNQSLDFPVPIDDSEDSDDFFGDSSEIDSPSSLPLASLSQIEEDDELEYDELGAEDYDEDGAEYFEEFDADFDEDDESDDDIIILDE